MSKGIYKKDERMFTALNDLMRTYLTHHQTPNTDKQLKDLFNEYFTWHEQQVERGLLEDLGGPTGSQQNRFILAGQLALSAPRVLPGPSDWMKPGRLASLIKLLRDIAYDAELYRQGDHGIGNIFY